MLLKELIQICRNRQLQHAVHRTCDTCSTVPGRSKKKRGADLTDDEVRAIIVQAMADVEADPALIYAFKKTGVYVCNDNEKHLSKESREAFNAAVDEYFDALNAHRQ